jgi:hypothetical protein
MISEPEKAINFGISYIYLNFSMVKRSGLNIIESNSSKITVDLSVICMVLF